MVQIISKTPGLSPGTLVYTGNKTEESVRISVIDYTPETIEEKFEMTPEDLIPYMERESITWINIDGIHDLTIIDRIGKIFNLHPLVMEDIVNTNHRAKLDEFNDHLFLVLKMPQADDNDNTFTLEHICLLMGKGFLISFQEKEVNDLFNPIRERLRQSKSRIRQCGTDYLAYGLMDMVVDHYFAVLEQVEEEIEILQEAVLDHPEVSILSKTQAIRHRIILLRRAIWPLREILSSLLRGESAMIDDKYRLYFQDVYDHVIQTLDIIETNRDQVAGIIDIYMSSVSNKMNDVMRVLTIIATLFIPMTFIAGVYGMNFKYMPELEWRYAYPFFWGVVLAVLCIMMIWFKRNKWL